MPFRTKSHPKSLGPSQGGQIVLAIFAGMAILFTLAGYFGGVYLKIQRMQTRSNFFNTLSEVQSNLKNTINSFPSWQATISDPIHNSSMACLANQSCSPSSNNTFVLWPAEVSGMGYQNLQLAVYDGTHSSSGYQIDGTPCPATPPGGGAPCPIHINLTWATCGPSCTPAVTITAKFVFTLDPSSAVGPINPDNYKFTFTQVLTGGNELCSGSPPPAVLAACQNPPYPNDRIYCLPTGWQCGEIYY